MSLRAYKNFPLLRIAAPTQLRFVLAILSIYLSIAKRHLGSFLIHALLSGTPKNSYVAVADNRLAAIHHLPRRTLSANAFGKASSVAGAM